MKFWLATTDVATVARLRPYGLFGGILTNPESVAASQRSPRALFTELCEASPWPVYYQVREAALVDMQREVETMLAIDPKKIGIKVGFSPAGLQLLHWLREQSMTQQLMATCIPVTSHVVIASSLGIPWVTPWASMQEKVGGASRWSILAEMRRALEQQRATTQIVSGIYQAADITSLALLGISHGFIWDKDVAKILNNELVASAIASFEPAWKNTVIETGPAASPQPGGSY